MQQVKLSAIMSTDLVTVFPTDTLDRVTKIFNENNFHHLPVVNEHKKLVGILSKSDYLMLCDSMSFFKGSKGEGQNKRFFKSMLVQDVMRKNIAKLKPDNTVMVAVGFFKENLFHAIPIVDDNEKLLGIVTTFDLINFAFKEPFIQT